MTTPPWSTERLLLRDFTASDLDDLARILLNPNNYRYTTASCRSLSDVEMTLQKWLSWIEEAPRTNFKMAVIREADGRLIGEAAFYRRGLDYSVGNIGWTIDEPCWNQGYASEVGRFLIDLGMNHFQQHRVWADCHSKNAASRRVLEKIGMKYEGTLRKNAYRNGEWTDSDVFSIVRETGSPDMAAE